MEYRFSSWKTLICGNCSSVISSSPLYHVTAGVGFPRTRTSNLAALPSSMERSFNGAVNEGAWPPSVFSAVGIKMIATGKEYRKLGFTSFLLCYNGSKLSADMQNSTEHPACHLVKSGCPSLALSCVGDVVNNDYQSLPHLQPRVSLGRLLNRPCWMPRNDTRPGPPRSLC